MYVPAEYKQSPGEGAPIRGWVLTDLADSRQLGTPQRLRAKMETVIQALHTATATPLARAGEDPETDMRVRTAEQRTRLVETRLQESEARRLEAETRLWESEARRLQAETRQQEAEARQWEAERERCCSDKTSRSREGLSEGTGSITRRTCSRTNARC